MAVLTDGATWHVYLPAMQGSYDERRVYLLDLAERDPAESAARLERYLGREAVESGEAEERAKADYKRSRQRRESVGAIPQAWANLVAGEGTRLVDLVAAEVESVSGFQPHPDDVAAFLGSLRPSSATLPSPTPSKPQPVSPEPIRAGAWSGKGVALPEGTELRARYKGQNAHAVISGGFIVLDGQPHRTPSAAGTAFTGKAINGWTFWEARRPGNAGWRRLDSFRT